MATSNEGIRDDLIRHRVDIGRFANFLATRMRAILNRAEPRLRTELKARLERIAHLGFDTGPVTTRRIARLEALIRELNRPTFDAINQLVRSELVAFAQGEAAFGAAAIGSNLPVAVALAIPDARSLRSAVFARPFERRILRDWLAAFEANDRRRFMDEIRQGLIFNETPVQISRRIFGTQALGGSDGARQITRRGAQTLANTVTAATSNAALQELYAQNSRIVKRELYVATLDSRTTPICRSLDGNTYDRGRGPVPPVHINCRSVRVPVIDGRRLGNRPANAATDDQLAGLRGPARRRAVEKLVGRVPASTNYQEWLGRQSVGFQNEVLGKTRGVLFRKGGLSLDRFVDASGRQFNLSELYEREADAFRRAGVPAP